MNVMTFNIRLNVASDGANSWPNRIKTVDHMMRNLQPDLIGMQEVLPDQLSDLKLLMRNYDWVGAGRENGIDKGEFCPIFYKSVRFKLVEFGHFGLSEQPSVFGLKGWDAACERIASWAVLVDLQNTDTFLVLNTHLDHMGEIARVESAKLIVEKVKQLTDNYPIIITGDFNSVPTSDVLSIFQSQNLHNASNIAKIKSGPNSTFHDFNRIEVSKRLTIDYVLVSDAFLVDSYNVIEDPDSSFISDHHPVMTKVYIK